MRVLLPAIALCAGLQAGAAPQQVPHTTPAITAAGQGELHAQLVTPRDGTPQRREQAVVVATSLQPANASPASTSGSADDHQPTTPAMLLAALALMTGIALRRWGAGQQ